MSGILGGIANLAGALSQGQDQQNQAKVQSALQQASLVRQQQQDQIAAAVREREANSSLLQDRLNQAKIDDTTAQAKQRQYEFDHPKAVAPVLGSPEYLQAETAIARAKAQADAQYGYHAAPAQHNIDPLSPEGIRARRELQQGKGGEGTPAQQLAGAQYSVAKDAAPGIDDYKPGIVSKMVSKIPVVGNTILGWTDHDYQQLDRDSRQFIESYMHAQGGRRVTQQEYDRLKGIYIPDPGDTPAQLARKAGARQTVLHSIHRMAGPVGDQVDAEIAGSTPAAAPVAGAVDPVLQEFGITPVRKH